MNNLWKVTRFQFYKMRMWSWICLAAVLFNLFIAYIVNAGNNDGAFTGSSIVSVTLTMMFVLGLNCFKGSFQFLLSNGVSRKTFYLGNIPFLAGISIAWSLTAVLISFLVQLTIGKTYTSNFWMDDLFCTAALLFFVCSVGWLINLIYYRSGQILKIVISVSPFLLILLFSRLNDLLNKMPEKILGRFIDLAFLQNLSKPLNSILLLLAFGVLCCGLCWPLLRRAQIKE